MCYSSLDAGRLPRRRGEHLLFDTVKGVVFLSVSGESKAESVGLREIWCCDICCCKNLRASAGKIVSICARLRKSAANGCLAPTHC